MYIDTTNAAAGRIVLNAERADKDAYGKEIHRFYESMVPQGTIIPANVDLNTINFLQVGNYYCSKNDTVKTLTNCPTDLAFMMQVYSPLSVTVDNESTGTWVYRLRKITTHKGKEYYQAVNSNGTAANFTYGEWYEKLSSEGKLTLSGDLSGSVDLSNSMTLTADITASGVTAGKYGPTANSTPAHGASFKVPEFTVAADGRITAATTRTITLPADNNTTYGLSAESGHIIQLKDNNNGVTKVTLVQGQDMVLTTDTTNDKITIAHETFTTTKASTNTTAAPAHGGTFDVLDSVTTDNGHVTGYTVKTVTLPADNNATYTFNNNKTTSLTLTGAGGGATTSVALKAGTQAALTAGDKEITIAHGSVATTPATGTASPSHGGTFKAIDAITTDNGHITGYTTKTITLPADNNTTYTISAKNNIITLDGSSGTDTTVTLAAGNNINVSTGTSDNKITVKHADFTTTPTTSTATDKSPAHGGSFSVIDGITTSNGHVTGYTTKSVKLPADNNTTSSLSAEYNSTDKKHQVRLTESSGTTYNVELAPGNDITLTTDTTNDKITITHEAFTTTGTTSSATDKTPAHGGSFSVIDGITTDNGHVTGYTTKSIKLPADNNTTYTLDLDSNAKVTLNASTGTDTNVTFTAGNDIVVTPNTTDKTINIKHQDFTTTKNSTNAAAAPAHGGTVEVLGSITVDNGHVTGYQNKTITLPADNNTTSALSAEANNIIQLKESSGTTYKVTLAAGNDIGLTTDTSTDTITIKHTDFSTTEGTGTTAAPAHGTSFTVLDSITTDNGHVTGFVKKTVTLPADNNTDTKVTQTAKSDNVNYPLLGAYQASPTSGTAAGTVYDTGMHMNPSTNTITATTFAGNLSGNATTASSCSGNAATATKLAAAQTISLTGDVTGSASFTGNSACTITATVADDSHNHSYAGAIQSVNPASQSIASRITYISGGFNLGTGDNQIQIDGMTGNPNHISAPAAGCYHNETSGNVQVARFAWPSSNYWTELYMSPNYDGFWHGSVKNGVRSAWKRMWMQGDAVTGAVWNDYAECRESDCYEAGYVLSENGDDTLSKSIERLAPFAGVSSDTWGFSQGETEKAKTHIAVAGRVLVYPYQNRNNYKPGDCVCAAPGGTVDIMTREEIREWPDRIVGTVSCVPEYEEWGGGEGADRGPVKVNGRIWIKVK